MVYTVTLTFHAYLLKVFAKLHDCYLKKNLRQVGGFLQGHLVSFTNKTEILLKVALSTHNPNPYLKKYKLTPVFCTL